MSIQCSEKLTNYSPVTTTNSSVKTPFGIEDILYINNNNLPNVTKNNSLIDKNNCVRSSVKTNEAEEFKKILSSER